MKDKQQKGLIIFIVARLSQLTEIKQHSVFLKAKQSYKTVLVAAEEFKDDIPSESLSLFDEMEFLSADIDDGLFLLFDPDKLRDEIIKHTQNYHPEQCYVFFSGECNITTVADATKGLGIHTFDHTKAILFRNKDKMKEYLAGYSINVPRHIHHFKNHSFEGLTKTLGCPFVVKPVDRAGSQGFNLIHDEEQYAALLDEVDNLEEYTAETFINGTLYHFDSTRVDGKVVVEILSEYGHPASDLLKGQAIFSVLVPEPNEAQQKLVIEHRKVLDAFNVDGNFHAEYFLSENGDVCFLEIAWRPAGRPVNCNYSQYTGLDQTSVYIGLKTKTIDQSDVKLNVPKYFQVMLMKQQGEYNGFSLPDTIAHHEVLYEIPLGSSSVPATSSLDISAIINVYGDSYEELYDNFLAVRDAGAIAQFI